MLGNSEFAGLNALRNKWKGEMEKETLIYFNKMDALSHLLKHEQ